MDYVVFRWIWVSRLTVKKKLLEEFETLVVSC